MSFIRPDWSDLDRLAQPTDAGRRLDVGAFVLADPFETILRHLSREYLAAAWQRLMPALLRAGRMPDDLSWGWLHPVESRSHDLPWGPGCFVGWTSRQLAGFDLAEDYTSIDGELRKGHPALGCAVTWRSLKWSIAPDDYTLALRLIERVCTEELTEWDPGTLVSAHVGESGAWLDVARAILAPDQSALNRAIADAQAIYSPLGYRIVVRAYREICAIGDELVFPVERMPGA